MARALTSFCSDFDKLATSRSAPERVPARVSRIAGDPNEGRDKVTWFVDLGKDDSILAPQVSLDEIPGLAHKLLSTMAARLRESDSKAASVSH